MPDQSAPKPHALLRLSFAALLAVASGVMPALSQQDKASGRDAVNVQSAATDRDATGGSADARTDVKALMRQLTDRDALTRQRAAEDLARLAPPAQRILVEGYRLQEKNARVRLALDWALYRMGKTPALFAVVRDLDTNRWNQSEAYLAELETPDPLYPLLAQVNGNTQVKLLEALARAGNAETLPVVEPYAASIDPRIADAARFATREITRRLNAPAHPDAKKRTRQVGKTTATLP